jgi:hypothetical protein
MKSSEAAQWLAETLDPTLREPGDVALDSTQADSFIF